MATTIILSSIAIVLLIILVAWLVWRNQCQGRTITAIFALCVSLSFISCATEDNPVVGPDPDSHPDFGGIERTITSTTFAFTTAA